MKTNELPAVAKSFYHECSKCECERYFKVLAHTSTTAAKIECEVCGSKRKYTIAKTTKKKAAKKATTKKTAKKKTRRTSKKAEEAHQEAYLAFEKKFSGKAPISYTASGKFTQEMVIDHPSFGIGYVTTCVPHKIEVVFKEGVKSLVHQYTP